MHKMTSKRQVTLPQSVCQALDLAPGDFVEIFERDGVAHLVKMTPGTLKGAFADLSPEFEGEPDFRAMAKLRTARKFAGDKS